MRIIDTECPELMETLEWESFETRQDIQDWLNGAPTMDAVPIKHAYWKSVPNKITRICSHCKHDEPYKFADANDNVFIYCPYCGARMDSNINS